MSAVSLPLALQPRSAASYLRTLSDALALRDWTFVVSEQPAEPGFNAQICPLRARRRAIVRLSERFSNLPPEIQRHTMVHELLHCHLAPAQSLANEVLPQNMRGAFDLNLEMSVDALADAFAPLLPLP